MVVMQTVGSGHTAGDTRRLSAQRPGDSCTIPDEIVAEGWLSGQKYSGLENHCTFWTWISLYLAIYVTQVPATGPLQVVVGRDQILVGSRPDDDRLLRER